MKKSYEVSHDERTDWHLIVQEGYEGLTKQELEQMESVVQEVNKRRQLLADEIRQENQKEKEKLDELPVRPWQKQKDKYDQQAAARPVGDPSKNRTQKKRGCTSCAKKGLMGLIKGGAQLLKAELGVDAADEATMETRKALCLECPTYDFGVCIEEEGGCGCFVAAKIKLEGEECPKGKW